MQRQVKKAKVSTKEEYFALIFMPPIFNILSLQLQILIFFSFKVLCKPNLSFYVHLYRTSFRIGGRLKTKDGGFRTQDLNITKQQF